MCKILVMPVVTPETEGLAWQIAKNMSKVMSQGNRDGLGYAAINGEGELFGERWLNNHQAFDERIEVTPFDKHVIEGYQGFLHKSERYNKFGPVSEINTRSIILHTRFATSSKEFENTHPFVDGDTALIHNGVISNINKKDLKQSTCDSEKILNEYVKHKVMDRPTAIRQVAGALDGYYACAILSKTKDDTPILDVFKCDLASLGAAWVRELGGVVITTQLSDLLGVAKELNLNLTSWYEVKGGVMLRFNALTGQVIGAQKFSPKKMRSTKKTNSGKDWDGWSQGYSNAGYSRDSLERPANSWPDGYRKDINGKGSVTHSELTGHIAGDTNEPGKSASNPAGTALRLVTTHSSAEDGWLYNDRTKVWKKVF